MPQTVDSPDLNSAAGHMMDRAAPCKDRSTMHSDFMFDIRAAGLAGLHNFNLVWDAIIREIAEQWNAYLYILICKNVISDWTREWFCSHVWLPAAVSEFEGFPNIQNLRMPHWNALVDQGRSDMSI